MKTPVNRILYFYNGLKVPQIGLGTYNLKGNDCIATIESALKMYIYLFKLTIIIDN